MSVDVPISVFAPLEYSLAMNAACVWLTPFPPIKILCEQPPLEQEMAQRLPNLVSPPWNSGLWLEPQASSWKQVLIEFTDQLSSGSRLAIILSLPLARRLPERRTWLTASLGERPGGLETFTHALPERGFVLNSIYGFHSAQSVLLNLIAGYARKLNFFTLADRIEFFSHQHYIKLIAKAWYATCALVLATRR